MIVADERLAVRVGTARARFVEDYALALKDSEPSKADLEDALREQIGHGRQLLEMVEVACRLASVAPLRPNIHRAMESSLAVGLKAFRDLQETVADWTRRHGVSPEGERDLGFLVVEMTHCRAELAFRSQEHHSNAVADPLAFPELGTTEWAEMNRRRAELIRKNICSALSEEEREEYETLQQMSLAALDSSFSQQGNAREPEEHAEANGE